MEAFDCTNVDIDIEDFYHGEGLVRCGIDDGILCIATSLEIDHSSVSKYI